MTLSLLLVAAGCRQATGPEAFSSYFLKHRDIEVQFSVVVNGQKGAGTYRLKRGKLHRLDLKLADSNYSFLQSPAGSLELERNQAMYVEEPPYPVLYAPESRISEAPSFGFPLPILAGDLYKTWPGKTTATKGADSTPELEHWTFATESRGTTKSEAWIRANGQLSRYDYELETQNDTIKASFVFAGYKDLTDRDVIGLEIPDGFVPYALANELEPIQPGSDVPSELGAKSGLALIVAKDDPLSAAAIVRFSELSPTIVTATRSLFEKLKMPGLPFFVLKKGGKVARIWYGFDRSSPNTLFNEIKGALGITKASE